MVEIKHKTLGVIGKEPEAQMAEADLKSLVELGCIKDEIDIGGRKFVIKTLGSLDRIRLAQEYDKDATEEDKIMYNIKMLACSIESIDNFPVESYHPNPEKDVLKAKMEIIGALQTPVILRLLEGLQEIMKRCDAQFSTEQVKN